MDGRTRGSRERVVQRDAASLQSSLLGYEKALQDTGFALAKLHQLVMTRVCAEDDLELAERLNDEVKPLIDYLIHFDAFKDVR